MPSSARGRSQQHQRFANSLQDKLRELENLIVSFKGSTDANKGILQSRHGKTGARSLENISALVDSNHTEASEWETVDQHHVSETFGRISLENTETKYVGDAHWIAILDGVRCFHRTSECIHLQPDEADLL